MIMVELSGMLHRYSRFILPFFTVPAAKIKYRSVPLLILEEALAYLSYGLDVFIAVLLDTTVFEEFTGQGHCLVFHLSLSEINGVFWLLKGIPGFVSHFF